MCHLKTRLLITANVCRVCYQRPPASGFSYSGSHLYLLIVVTQDLGSYSVVSAPARSYETYSRQIQPEIYENRLRKLSADGRQRLSFKKVDPFPAPGLGPRHHRLCESRKNALSGTKTKTAQHERVEIRPRPEYEG